MLCATINGPLLLDAEKQIDASLPYVDCVEIRVDLFSSLSIHELQALMRRANKTILTLKPSAQLSQDAWIEQTFQLAQLNPYFLTIDERFPYEALDLLKQRYPEVKTIYSYHSETAEDATKIYARLSKVPATIYKIVIEPKNSVQALEYLAVKKQLPANTSLLGSGAFGSFLRFLSPTIGNAINYTYGPYAKQLNPGQVPLDELFLYNYENQTPQGFMFALIGEYINRSISHIANNDLFRQLHLPFCHVKYPLQTHELEAFFLTVRKLPFHGMSVTAPFKSQVLQYVDHIAPSAKNCQAANTLTFSDKGITAHNTDGEGLAKLLEYKNIQISQKNIAILGAGGVAKAIIHSLTARGASVTIFNRTLDKAQQLAMQYGSQAAPLSLFAQSGSFDIIISCLTPNIPLPDVFAPVVVDVNTIPRESEYLKKAKNLGCFVIYGYEMFAEQAILQFNLWLPGIFSKDMQEPFRQKVKNIMYSF